MPYLNSEVFYRALEPDACELLAMPPRAMAAAVEDGTLQGGPLPVAEVLRMGSLLREVGGLGVACQSEAMSVFLFSDRPAKSLNGQRIAVTAHTATSIQLLRVLAKDRWRINPAFVSPDETSPARLVIGDEAIRLNKTGNFPHVYDLSEEWRKLTGLPFVFALWVLRSDVPEAAAKAFDAALRDAYFKGLQIVDEIAAARATDYLTEAEAAEYVRHFTYMIGDAERKGIAEFKRRMSQLPEWRPGLVEPFVNITHSASVAD